MQVREGKAVVNVSRAAVVSRGMDVFYNPVMKPNRDIAILLLNCWDRDSLRMADPLAGSGVRSIRMLLELPASRIASVSINDASPSAVRAVRRNLVLNHLRESRKIVVGNTEASKFLIDGSSFDYIDIDPFGYPGIFLDAAVKRVSRAGVLAVTATDTAALAGTAPAACRRKYWAEPVRDYMMHETGLRILIRRVQLVAAAHGRAAVPLLSYFRDHYMRVFFLVSDGRKRADEVMRQHQYFFACDCLRYSLGSHPYRCSASRAGPLWSGLLCDPALVRRMAELADRHLSDFLNLLANELPGVGFYDVHELCRMWKLPSVPPHSDVLASLRKNYKVSRTHFSPYGFRTDAPPAAIRRACRRLRAC